MSGVANPEDPDNQEFSEAAKSKYLGVAIICGAERGRYSKMVEELQNDFTKGNRNYPANTTKAYNLLLNYNISYNTPTRLVDDSEEVLFANVGGSEGKSNAYKSGGGGRERKVICYYCGKLSHIVRKCPNQK